MPDIAQIDCNLLSYMIYNNTSLLHCFSVGVTNLHSLKTKNESKKQQIATQYRRGKGGGVRQKLREEYFIWKTTINQTKWGLDICNSSSLASTSDKTKKASDIEFSSSGLSDSELTKI